MRVMLFEGNLEKNLATASGTQIVKLAENQTINKVCFNNHSYSISFRLTEDTSRGSTASQIPSAANYTTLRIVNI